MPEGRPQAMASLGREQATSSSERRIESKGHGVTPGPGEGDGEVCAPGSVHGGNDTLGEERYGRDTRSRSRSRGRCSKAKACKQGDRGADPCDGTAHG